MPDYGEILRFLAQNPPQLDAERKVHASLLELLAQCLRESQQAGEGAGESLEERIANSHLNWVHFN